MEYMRQYVADRAYIAQQGGLESWKEYKCRIYTIMVVLRRETPELLEMRIQRIWPNSTWMRIWHNLHDAPVTDDIKTTWYRAIHDIIPTHARLKRINMITSPLCRECNTDDDIQHRIVDCGEGRQMWDWTKDKLTEILETTPNQILDEWVTRPYFIIWPPKWRRAALWIIANFVDWRLR
jgi:hypothetical protein